MASSPSQLAVPSLAVPSLDSSAGFQTQLLVTLLPCASLQPAAYPWGQPQGPAGEGKQLLIAKKEGWMRQPKQKLNFQAWFHLWLEQGTEIHILKTPASGDAEGARGYKQDSGPGKVWAQPAWLPREAMSEL